MPSSMRALVARLCRTYGTRITKLLAGVARVADLGPDFGAGLTVRELEYLVAHEWAETAEDVLWRRSKLGLRFGRDATVAIEDQLDHVRRTLSAATTGGKGR